MLPANKSHLRCGKCSAPICSIECLARHVETHYVTVCI